MKLADPGRLCQESLGFRFSLRHRDILSLVLNRTNLSTSAAVLCHTHVSVNRG